MSPDDADVATLARAATYVSADAAGRSDRWQEAGYWLTPIVCGLILPFFRRGWLTPTGERR